MSFSTPNPPVHLDPLGEPMRADQMIVLQWVAQTGQSPDKIKDQDHVVVSVSYVRQLAESARISALEGRATSAPRVDVATTEDVLKRQIGELQELREAADRRVDVLLSMAATDRKEIEQLRERLMETMRDRDRESAHADRATQNMLAAQLELKTLQLEIGKNAR